MIAAVGLPRMEPDGSTRRRTGTACCRRANSSGLPSPARFCQEPDYLFLDEATASLDEAAEAALYRLLQERLKATTIISIGHRSTLGAFHRRRVEVTPGDDGFAGARRAAGLGGGVIPACSHRSGDEVDPSAFALAELKRQTSGELGRRTITGHFDRTIAARR